LPPIRDTDGSVASDALRGGPTKPRRTSPDVELFFVVMLVTRRKGPVRLRWNGRRELL